MDISSSDSHESASTPSSTGLVSQTKAQQTVSTYFRFSLLELLQKLNNSSPHFVRCLKPNDFKKPLSFVVEKILEQLNYTGIMETIAIRRQGFSHRIPYADFVARYAFLAFSFDEEVIPNRDTARLLLLRLHLDGFALGKTKLFLKYYHIEFLSREYERQLKKIVKVQAFARRWLAKRRADHLRRVIAKRLMEIQKQKKLQEQQAFQRQLQQPVKHGWLGRKRGAGTESKTQADPRNNKTANRQDSPDLPVSSGKENKGKKPTPNKAAILIQKCVRGYLTRKKVKAIQTKDNSSHQRLMQLEPPKSNHTPHFQATRMQLYQQHQQEILKSSEVHNQQQKQPTKFQKEMKMMRSHPEYHESRISSHDYRLPVSADNA